MMNKAKALMGLTACLALAGCGKSQDSRDLDHPVSEPRIQQTWQSDCASSELLDLSQRTYLKFSGTAYHEVHVLYSEAGCVGEAVEVRFGGNFALHEPSPADTYSADVRYETVELTALSPAGRDVLEKAKFCGVERWELGRAENLVGRTGTLFCPLRKVPSGEYNLVSIEGDKLFLGKSGMRAGATVESGRPKEVDHDRPFRTAERDL
jgi:hypothetical protein